MKVGFRHGHFDDASRPNWDGDAPRRLTWTAWYPTSDSVVEHERLLGPPDAPTFTIGMMSADAPLPTSQQRHPLVLLSHGTGGSAQGMGWLGRRLAQRGLIAVGINHHGNTLAEPYRAEGFLCWWERPRDLTVLLDHLLTTRFGEHIDPSRIYVAGYSLGGCTAAALTGAIAEQSRFQRTDTSRDYARGVPEFPDLADHLPALLATNPVFQESWARMSRNYHDPRFKAALMLAPGRALFGLSEASLSTITTPTHIIVGIADPTLAAANWLHEQVKSSTLDVLAPDVGHYVFLPEATEAGRRAGLSTGLDAQGVDRRAIHERTATAAIDLFR